MSLVCQADHVIDATVFGRIELASWVSKFATEEDGNTPGNATSNAAGGRHMVHGLGAI